MPLILGEGNLIPGFEDNLVGAAKGEEREFDVVFPEDYQEESLRGQKAHFAVTVKELRAKVLPEARTSSLGPSASSRIWPASSRAAQTPRNECPRPCSPRLRRQDHRSTPPPTPQSTCRTS